MSLVLALDFGLCPFKIKQTSGTKWDLKFIFSVNNSFTCYVINLEMANSPSATVCCCYVEHMDSQTLII